MTLYPQRTGEQPGIPASVDISGISQEVLEAMIDDTMLEELGIHGGESIISSLSSAEARTILGNLAVN